MANPFLITPADYTGGIENLSSAISSFKEQRDMKDQKVRAQEIQKSFTDAYRSGDYDKIAELSISNPEIGNRVFEAMGTAEEASKGRMIRDAWSMVNDPSKAEAVLQQRIADSQAQGVPADQSIKELEFLRSNPEGYTEKYIKPVLASIDPKGWTDYKKALIAGEPEAITPYQQAQLDMQERTFAASRSDAAFNRQMKRLEHDLKIAESRAKSARGTIQEELALQQLQDARAKTERAKSDEKSGLESSYSSAVDTLNLVNEIDNHPGTYTAVGAQSFIPSLPGSKSKSAEKLIDTLKSQNFLLAVQQMKGMGALSDAEGKKLDASIAALDISQSDEDFKKNLNSVRMITDRAKKKAEKKLKSRGYDIPVVKNIYKQTTDTFKPNATSRVQFSEVSDEDLLSE